MADYTHLTSECAGGASPEMDTTTKVSTERFCNTFSRWSLSTCVITCRVDTYTHIVVAISIDVAGSYMMPGVQRVMYINVRQWLTWRACALYMSSITTFILRLNIIVEQITSNTMQILVEKLAQSRLYKYITCCDTCVRACVLSVHGN